MKMTSTLRATLGPVYRFLNGMLLPSASRTGKFSILFNVACEGISLFVLTSPAKSTVLSTPSPCFERVELVSMEVLGGVEEAFMVKPNVAAEVDSLAKGASVEIAIVNSYERLFPISSAVGRLADLGIGAFRAGSRACVL